MATPSRARTLVRRVVGGPVATGRVPARLPLLLERHHALFESITVPALPAPVLLVHTGGKPMDYQASRQHPLRRSMPGLVTFLPRHVRSQVALRGVGEGMLIYFVDEIRLPGWLVRSVYRDPVTFTNDVIVALARRLMGAIESGEPDGAYLRTLGNALLAELQHELARSPASTQLPASRSGSRVAHTAIRHMLRHLDERLAVDDLARVCGLGATTFSSGFRQATGLSPHRYLRKARIERSCELLRTTVLSIREVAEAVGFGGQSHFCTAFSQERGLTPSAYRRACRAARPA